jgi:hypothetical protein
MKETKHTYYLETEYDDGKWFRSFSASLSYLKGYLEAFRNMSPRTGKRVVDETGHVHAELDSYSEVGIGMIAGWPTAEQYERAAARALDQASKVRARHADEIPAAAPPPDPWRGVREAAAGVPEDQISSAILSAERFAEELRGRRLEQGQGIPVPTPDGLEGILQWEEAEDESDDRGGVMWEALYPFLQEDEDDLHFRIRGRTGANGSQEFYCESDADLIDIVEEGSYVDSADSLDEMKRNLARLCCLIAESREDDTGLEPLPGPPRRDPE